MSHQPSLRVIDAGASPEEVAAIIAAVTAALASAAPPAESVSVPTSRWVEASRLQARRTGQRRGEWRFSGRIGRRNPT